MLINGKTYQTIWPDEKDKDVIKFINQNYLPFRFVVDELHTSEDSTVAIHEMKVRGAPLIGVTAAFGIYLAAMEAKSMDNSKDYIFSFANKLMAVRPTAINLKTAINRQLEAIKTTHNSEDLVHITFKTSLEILNEEKEKCRQIGLHGLPLIEKIALHKPGQTVHILTHCNAGWLACIDYGTATAPIYLAYDKGIPVHVWVDETRPRNQGSRLTAWELKQHGLPHTVIVDNAGGYLMQSGMIDLVIVGTDRTTRSGYVANKIGTYLKALAAFDNNVPFYVAVPSSSIDLNITRPFDEIPIEERDDGEVRFIEGLANNKIIKVQIMESESPVSNYGFDITPPRLITGLITERGVCEASEEGLHSLFPEKFKSLE
jgi:methylthioribose-1-phosphate isomerase